MENETIEIVKELPPAKVMLVALDLGKWDCERSLAELSALAEANHMENLYFLYCKPALYPSAFSTMPQKHPERHYLSQ